MKREIKFRAWDTNEFLDEPEMYSNEKLNELDRNGLLHLCDIIEGKEPKVFLMQYTGLKDCTGREIYEGDVLSHPLTNKKIIVEHGLTGWLFVCGERHIDYSIQFEIIGNIYSTPELLNTPPVNP